MTTKTKRVWRTSRLARDGTAEPVPRDQILRRERGQGNVYFPCSTDHKQDWQPYPVDPYSATCDDHRFGEDGGQLDRRRVRGGLNPLCARIKGVNRDVSQGKADV